MHEGVQALTDLDGDFKTPGFFIIAHLHLEIFVRMQRYDYETQDSEEHANHFSFIDHIFKFVIFLRRIHSDESAQGQKSYSVEKPVILHMRRVFTAHALPVLAIATGLTAK